MSSCANRTFKEDKSPFDIRFEDMFLIKFTQVAKASWQPDIWHQNAPSTDT
jgi:hypothetical protein